MKHNNHLKLAHHYWSELVSLGDLVIDATCGNGQDTLFLAKIALSEDSGTLFAIDIQPAAIESAKKNLIEQLPVPFFDRVKFILGSHATFPEEIKPGTVKLIVYNLGYLPGGDKTRTTLTESTLKSIESALKLISNEGMISITCYPGHEEGKKEEDAILIYCATLDPHHWTCHHHRWINRNNAPSLLIIKKNNRTF